jgi:hypothetical protein
MGTSLHGLQGFGCQATVTISNSLRYDDRVIGPLLAPPPPPPCPPITTQALDSFPLVGGVPCTGRKNGEYYIKIGVWLSYHDSLIRVYVYIRGWIDGWSGVGLCRGVRTYLRMGE